MSPSAHSLLRQRELGQRRLTGWRSLPATFVSRVERREYGDIPAVCRRLERQLVVAGDLSRNRDLLFFLDVVLELALQFGLHGRRTHDEAVQAKRAFIALNGPVLLQRLLFSPLVDPPPPTTPPEATTSPTPTNATAAATPPPAAAADQDPATPAAAPPLSEATVTARPPAPPASVSVQELQAQEVEQQEEADGETAASNYVVVRATSPAVKRHGPTVESANFDTLEILSRVLGLLTELTLAEDHCAALLARLPRLVPRLFSLMQVGPLLDGAVSLAQELVVAGPDLFGLDTVDNLADLACGLESRGFTLFCRTLAALFSKPEPPGSSSLPPPECVPPNLCLACANRARLVQVPNLVARIVALLKVVKLAEFEADTWTTLQSDLLFVVATLLGNKAREQTQVLLIEHGFVDTLAQMFQRLDWKSPTDSPRGQGEHGPGCTCCPQSCLQVSLLRTLAAFCEKNEAGSTHHHLLLSHRQRLALHEASGSRSNRTLPSNSTTATATATAASEPAPITSTSTSTSTSSNNNNSSSTTTTSSSSTSSSGGSVAVAEAVAASLAQSGEQQTTSLVACIAARLVEQPRESPYYFELASALHRWLQGSTPQEQEVVLRLPGFVQWLCGELLAMSTPRAPHHDDLTFVKEQSPREDGSSSAAGDESKSSGASAGDEEEGARGGGGGGGEGGATPLAAGGLSAAEDEAVTATPSNATAEARTSEVQQMLLDLTGELIKFNPTALLLLERCLSSLAGTVSRHNTPASSPAARPGGQGGLADVLGDLLLGHVVNASVLVQCVELTIGCLPTPLRRGRGAQAAPAEEEANESLSAVGDGSGGTVDGLHGVDEALLASLQSPGIDNDYASMSLRELKQMMAQRRMSTARCLEKADLIAALEAHDRSATGAFTAAPVPAGSGLVAVWGRLRPAVALELILTLQASHANGGTFDLCVINATVVLFAEAMAAKEFDSLCGAVLSLHRKRRHDAIKRPRRHHADDIAAAVAAALAWWSRSYEQQTHERRFLEYQSGVPFAQWEHTVAQLKEQLPRHLADGAASS